MCNLLSFGRALLGIEGVGRAPAPRVTKAERWKAGASEEEAVMTVL
jgi:hypothetical protein